MDRKRYSLIRIAIVTAVGCTVSYAVSVNNPLIALISVVAGILILKLAERGVDEPLIDERVERISEKASRRTLEIIGVFGALLSATLIASGREEGYVLGFLICVSLVLYMVFYAVYSKRAIE